MKYLIQICVVFVLACVASAYWIDSDPYMAYPDDIDEAGIDAINSVKRSHNVCMRWGMVCVPESSLKFTKCCRGLNCVCNIWNTHCRCRAKLG